MGVTVDDVSKLDRSSCTNTIIGGLVTNHTPNGLGCSIEQSQFDIVLSPAPLCCDQTQSVDVCYGNEYVQDLDSNGTVDCTLETDIVT